MKKIIVLFVFSCFVSISAFSQSETSVGAFFSLPVGPLAGTGIEDGGYAEPGWGIVLNSKMRAKSWSEKFSLLFNATYSLNKIDNNKIAEVYTAYYENETTVSESRYAPITVTIGPRYEFDLGEKFTIGADVTGGIMFTNTKAFTLVVYDESGTELNYEVINFNNHPVFAYRFGLDFGVNVVKDLLDVRLFGAYMGAQQDVEATFTLNSPINGQQKMGYIQTGIQFTFLFNN